MERPRGFEEVYSRTLQSSAGADLQIAETRKIRNANVQINGKLVS